MYAESISHSASPDLSYKYNPRRKSFFWNTLHVHNRKNTWVVSDERIRDIVSEQYKRVKGKEESLTDAKRVPRWVRVVPRAERPSRALLTPANRFPPPHTSFHFSASPHGAMRFQIALFANNLCALLIWLVEPVPGLSLSSLTFLKCHWEPPRSITLVREWSL